MWQTLALLYTGCHQPLAIIFPALYQLNLPSCVLHLNFRLSKSRSQQKTYKLGDEFWIYEDDISGPLTAEDVKEHLIRSGPSLTLSPHSYSRLYSQLFGNPSVFSWPTLTWASSRLASVTAAMRGGTTTARPRASWSSWDFTRVCWDRERGNCIWDTAGFSLAFRNSRRLPLRCVEPIGTTEFLTDPCGRLKAGVVELCRGFSYC